MADTSPESTPYGTWESPITAQEVAESFLDLGHIATDSTGIYWREERPAENGRGIICRHRTDKHDENEFDELTPPDFNVRTLVHEVGGGDFAVHDGVVYFSRLADQRLYRMTCERDDSVARSSQSTNASSNGSPSTTTATPPTTPEPITPAPETDRGLRYADIAVTADGSRLYCVREDHDAVAALDDVEVPVASLVTLPADGHESPTVVASGNDFYASPQLSPAGDKLAWLTWDFPQMPWDGTELRLADVKRGGSLTNERVVMGGPGESIFQPAWRPDGTLHAVSDRSGWWNLYRFEDETWHSYREEPAEYGFPQWEFGLSSYVFLADGRIAAIVTRDGRSQLELLANGHNQGVDLPFESVGHRLLTDGMHLFFTASGPTRPPSLYRWIPRTNPVTVRESMDEPVDSTYCSDPEIIWYPTRDGSQAHLLYYPPRHPDSEPPENEYPPLLVTVHGGPTARSIPDFNLGRQFFTSRGFAVASVNYRGSSGFGRSYRKALYGNWGVLDVADCVDAAQFLADEGRVDRTRMAIRGASAGGFVVLSALANHDVFAAGTSYSGVTDLERLVQTTHKLESRYLDNLIGPYPAEKATYRERSPVELVDGIDSPVLLLQGESDPVVPLSQAESMAAALEERDVPHELVVFEGERHGFRRKESREQALRREMSFYAEIFDIEPGSE